MPGTGAFSIASAIAAGMQPDEIDEVDESEKGDEAAGDQDGGRRNEPRIEVIARALLDDDHAGDDQDGDHQNDGGQIELQREHLSYFQGIVVGGIDRQRPYHYGPASERGAWTFGPGAIYFGLFGDCHEDP